MANLPRRWLAAEEEWGGLGMLDGIDHCRPQVAEMMSSVRRGNEAVEGGLDKHGVAFALASIPLVRKIASHWILPQLVSLQPMSGREGQFAFCRFDGQIAALPCVCRTRPVSDAVLPPVPPQDVGNRQAVAQLTQAIDRAAVLIADSLDTEVVTDLVRTATTVVNEPDDLLAGIDQAAEGVSRRLGGPGPTWALMNIETAQELGLEVRPRARFGFAEAGGLAVHVDMRHGRRVLPPRVVLVGRLGDEFYDAGFFFCPWLLVSGPPADGLPKDQLFVRYSKNVLAGKMNEYPRGTGYYARIHLKPGTKLGVREAPLAERRQVGLADILGGEEWGEDEPLVPDGGGDDWGQHGLPLDGEVDHVGNAERLEDERIGSEEEVDDGQQDGAGGGLQERGFGDGSGLPEQAAEGEGGGAGTCPTCGGPYPRADRVHEAVGGDGPAVPAEAEAGEGGDDPGRPGTGSAEGTTAAC